MSSRITVGSTGLNNGAIIVIEDRGASFSTELDQQEVKSLIRLLQATIPIDFAHSLMSMPDINEEKYQPKRPLSEILFKEKWPPVSCNTTDMPFENVPFIMPDKIS